MPKNVMLLLGNGVSIGFLKHCGIDGGCDLRNLFRLGANVHWPATLEPGFLSFKRCPSLWNLGARPTMSAEEAMSLIEDIITCVNVYALRPTHSLAKAGSRPNDIYIQAYKELTKYLKHLFVHYDKRLNPLPKEANDWPWAKYLISLNSNPDISQVRIITFNYDVWIERILTSLGIPFSIEGMTNVPGAKISILKPHGSISFCHKISKDRSAFEISKTSELIDGQLSDFEVRYDNLDGNYLVDALIPPAGEAARLPGSWAQLLRDRAIQWMESLAPGDELLISGLSYWHVDRHELDRLFVACNRDVDVRMINPSPSRTMSAVLTSLFEGYTFFPDTDVLEALSS